MEYKEIIKNYLEKEGISVRMLAMMCNISPKSIYFYLNGIKPGPRCSAKLKIGTRGIIDLNIPYKARHKKPGPKPLSKRRKKRANNISQEESPVISS